MKKVIVVLFVFFIQLGFGQHQKKIDSLKSELTKAADSKTQYYIHKEIATLFEKSDKIDSAEYHYNQSYKYSKKLDFDRQMDAKYNIADILRVKSKYKEALKIYIECLEQIGNRENETVASIYNGIANVYFRIRNYDESEKYYKKSIALSNKLGLLDKSHTGIVNLAQCMLFAKKDNNEILKLLTNLINDNKEIISKKNLGLAYSNLSQTYVYKRDLENAKKYLLKSIEIAKETGNKKSEIFRYFRLSNILHLNGEYQLTDKYLRENIDKLEKSNDLPNLIAAKGFLVQNQFYIDNNKRSIKDFSDYVKLKDSLYSKELTTSLKDIETKYQTQQKENEILKLTNQNIQKEAALAQSRYTIFGVLGALLLLIGFGYFYWNKRKQQHQLALLENSVKTSEAEKSRIGKELHDNIAGTLIKLVHDSETAQIKLSHKLLQTYNEVRELSHQLDNTPMHGELFIDRVLDIIPENTEKQTFNFKISPHHLQINEPEGTHIFRIIQELIANNLKYAKATETQLQIVFNDNMLVLTYKDNGVGTTTLKKGNGFKNIEDRIVLMNGSLKIKHQNGFSVTANIPYSA